MKNLLIITCYDSFLKASLNLAKIFKANQYSIDYFIYTDYRDIDHYHFREIGFDYPYKSGWIKDLFNDKKLFEYNAIMLSMEGPVIHKFYQVFVEQIATLHLTRRPVLFAGYVGIIYEKFMQGFMDRQPVDVYYVNCNHDLELFKSYCQKLKLPQENIFLTGLPMLDTAHHLKPDRQRRANSLLFAGQPTVPKSFRERKFIVQKLLDYARAHPDEKIYFKPRHRPNQSTLHVVMFHYEDIILHLKRNKKIPPNFILTYEPILKLLQKVDMCLTVSSTASFEALCMGIPVGIIVDFGISEKYGNYYFAHSNCITTFNKLYSKKSCPHGPEMDRSIFFLRRA